LSQRHELSGYHSEACPSLILWYKYLQNKYNRRAECRTENAHSRARSNEPPIPKKKPAIPSPAKVKVNGRRDLMTVLGNFMAPMPGEILKMQGEWAHHPKFSAQFKVVHYKSLVPVSVASIEKYLGSGLIKGIGPVMAKRIVKKFEKETLYRRYLKLSSPQMPVQNMRIISIIVLYH